MGFCFLAVSQIIQAEIDTALMIDDYQYETIHETINHSHHLDIPSTVVLMYPENYIKSQTAYSVHHKSLEDILILSRLFVI